MMKRTICHSEPKYWNKKYRSKKGNDLYVVGDDGKQVRVMYVNHQNRTSDHMTMSYEKLEELISKKEITHEADGMYVLNNRM